MSSHHPFREHDVLFQHQVTRKLRIKQFPDDDAFYAKDKTAVDSYFAALERDHARPQERIIRLAVRGDDTTEVPCPKCAEKLLWKMSAIA